MTKIHCGTQQRGGISYIALTPAVQEEKETLQFVDGLLVVGLLAGLSVMIFFLMK